VIDRQYATALQLPSAIPDGSFYTYGDLGVPRTLEATVHLQILIVRAPRKAITIYGYGEVPALNALSMKRVILLLHRYLGIGHLPLIVAAWVFVRICDDVMSDFRGFSAQDRIASLSPLDFANAVISPRFAPPPRIIRSDAFEIEMLAGRPVCDSNRGVTRTLIRSGRGCNHFWRGRATSAGTHISSGL